MSAVLPSADSATLRPNSTGPGQLGAPQDAPLKAPLPVSFACWVQVEPERVNTHAAPSAKQPAPKRFVAHLGWLALEWPASPPMVAVLPPAGSAERRLEPA